MVKQQFKEVKILHYAFLGGSLSFFLVALFVNNFKLNLFPDISKLGLFDYLPPFVLLMSIFMAFFMERTLKGAINQEGSIKDKMNNYKNRVLLRSAFLEGTALFATAIILMTQNTVHAIFFAIAWLLLLIVRPRVSEFVRDYRLNAEEEFELTKGL